MSRIPEPRRKPDPHTHTHGDSVRGKGGGHVSARRHMHSVYTMCTYMLVVLGGWGGGTHLALARDERSNKGGARDGGRKAGGGLPRPPTRYCQPLPNLLQRCLQG